MLDILDELRKGMERRKRKRKRERDGGKEEARIMAPSQNFREAESA
jgi:hypothetical protein